MGILFINTPMPIDNFISFKKIIAFKKNKKQKLYNYAYMA